MITSSPTLAPEFVQAAYLYGVTVLALWEEDEVWMPATWDYPYIDDQTKGVWVPFGQAPRSTAPMSLLPMPERDDPRAYPTPVMLTTLGPNNP